MQRIIYKEKGSNTQLTYQGSMQSFKASYPYPKYIIVRVESPLEWDEQLKKYV